MGDYTPQNAFFAALMIGVGAFFLLAFEPNLLQAEAAVESEPKWRFNFKRSEKKRSDKAWRDWKIWPESAQMSTLPTAQDVAESLALEAMELDRSLDEQWNAWVKKREFVEDGLTGDGASIEYQTVLKELEKLKSAPEHPYLDARFHHQLDQSTDSHLTAGNRMTLLANHQSWDLKRELMGVAKETLYVTAMIMRCDAGGRDFTEKMVAAAQRGVDTRFILDKLFSLYAFPCLKEMQEGGVDVVLAARSVQRKSIDWEMHEKLVIIDGEVGFIGGQNVGSWYQEATGTDDYYRDTDVMLTGPIVLDLANRFVKLWMEWRSPDAALIAYQKELERQREDAQLEGLVGAENYERWFSESMPSGLCRFVAQDPHEGTFHVWTAYQKHIEAANRRVMLTAYALDPIGSWQQEAFREALVGLAGKPGASVDIITNGPGVKGSAVVPGPLQKSYAKSILNQTWEGLGDTGVGIWTYDHFVHAKQYYFDGVAVGIGSFNYDASGNRCQESVVICMDPNLSDDMGRLFALDLSRSTKIEGKFTDPQ